MSTLDVYRDDGPLASLLAPFGRAFAPSALATLAVIPLFVAIAVEGGGASDGLIAAVFGWLVLLGGASRGGALERDRFRWAVPPLLRAGEYAGLVWLAPAAAFGLLLALAFRHYDLVYRLRFQGPPTGTPPDWLGTVAGGWEGRLVAGWVLLAAGGLPEGFYALAAILGALFVTECVASWRRFSTADGSAFYDEGEGEAE